MQLSTMRRFLIYSGMLAALVGFAPRQALADEYADYIKLPMSCEPWGTKQVRCLAHLGYHAKAVARSVATAKENISFQADSWQTTCGIISPSLKPDKSDKNTLVKNQLFNITAQSSGSPAITPQCLEVFLLNCTVGGASVDCYQMFTFKSDY